MHKRHALIRPLFLQLLDSYNNLPLSCLPSLSRSFWESPAIALTLNDTYHGQGLEDKDTIEFEQLIATTIDASESSDGKI